MATSGATLKVEFAPHATAECTEADHLGVVFVHGVGFQTRGETLLAWSHRLIRMLTARHQGPLTKPADLIDHSDIDLQGDRLSSVDVRIPAGRGERAQHWLLTEAFWAADFEPPSVPTMLRWLGARGGAALAAVGPFKFLRNSVYLTGIVIGALVVYAAIRIVTSIIPIAAVRDALVAPLDRLLTGWSGDLQVLLFDPAQSANIRASVKEAIAGATHAGFDRVALVAHSGGAVASYMTLTDDVLWTLPTDATAKLPKVVTLITLGQGLNIAWRLSGVGDGKSCDLARGSGRRLTANPQVNHPGLRWYDYFSEGDTVSESELSPPQCLQTVVPGPADRAAIQNIPANPHGSYWDNDEEFLLPLILQLEAIARTDAAPLPAPSSPTGDPLVKDRLLRIGMFSVTTRVLFGAMVTAIVGGFLLGGARIDDLGRLVADIASAIPGIGLLAGPLEALQRATAEGWWWAVPRGFGTFALTLLLVAAAMYPMIRLRLPKLAWEVAESRPQRWLIRVADVGAAILPLLPIATWLAASLRLTESGYAPAWAVLPALIVTVAVIAMIRLRVGPTETARTEVTALATALQSGVGAAVSVAILGFTVVGMLLAIVGNAEYGAIGLGAAVFGAGMVWLLFRLLGGVAKWRWDAWDDQEREQFRQVQSATDMSLQSRRWGRGVDFVVIGFAYAAAAILAAAVAAPFIGLGTAVAAGGLVVVLVALIWVVGSGQDAENSQSGVKPAEMPQLPTAAY